MRFSAFKAGLLLSVVAIVPARADVSLLAIGTLGAEPAICRA